MISQENINFHWFHSILEKKNSQKTLKYTNRIFFKTRSVVQHPQRKNLHVTCKSHFCWEVFFSWGELNQTQIFFWVYELNQAQVYFWVLRRIMECTVSLSLVESKVASSLFLTWCTYEVLQLIHWYCNWILPRLNFPWSVIIHQFSYALSMSWSQYWTIFITLHFRFGTVGFDYGTTLPKMNS